MHGSESALLVLLGEAELRCHDEVVRLPLGSLRLLSVLALQGGSITRPAAAEALWPALQSHRAAANLRSALSHCRRVADVTVVDCTAQRLRLTDHVTVDLHEMSRCAQQLTTLPQTGVPAQTVDPGRQRRLLDALSRGLLPDWSDEWVLAERERWDQIRLHALELLAHHLLTDGWHLAAMEVALTAVAVEPIRESAHRTVVEIHMAEGNSGCAIQHYHRYRRMLQYELGVPPSYQMDCLVRTLVSP